MDSHGFRSKTLKCATDNATNMIHCKGNITVQDFIPRKFSFSLGFKCNLIGTNVSLKGLVYNISVHRQTNKTNCVSLSLGLTDKCYPCFYSIHSAMSNLLGDPGPMTKLLNLGTKCTHLSKHVHSMIGQSQLKARSPGRE